MDNPNNDTNELDIKLPGFLKKKDKKKTILPLVYGFLSGIVTLPFGMSMSKTLSTLFPEMSKVLPFTQFAAVFMTAFTIWFIFSKFIKEIDKYIYALPIGILTGVSCHYIWVSLLSLLLKSWFGKELSDLLYVYNIQGNPSVMLYTVAFIKSFAPFTIFFNILTAAQTVLLYKNLTKKVQTNSGGSN